MSLSSLGISSALTSLHLIVPRQRFRVHKLLLFYFMLCFQLIDFMNLFYGNLDARFSKFQVYNVLTMTDDFMLVSGMPKDIGKDRIVIFLSCLILCHASGDKHVSEIAGIALDLLAGSVVFQIPHRPNSRLNIRMGFHRLASGQFYGTYII